MPSIADAIPLRGRPRHSRPLLAGYATAVAALVLLTVATASYGSRRWFGDVYDVVLPTVLFALPVAVGLALAVLGGGLVPTLALGVVPSLAWTAAVVLGRGLATLFGRPLPTPDSPLWAIAGAFLVIGLVGSFGGFLAGRTGRLGWRRLVG